MRFHVVTFFSFHFRSKTPPCCGSISKLFPTLNWGQQLLRRTRMHMKWYEMCVENWFHELLWPMFPCYTLSPSKGWPKSFDLWAMFSHTIASVTYLDLLRCTIVPAKPLLNLPLRRSGWRLLEKSYYGSRSVHMAAYGRVHTDTGIHFLSRTHTRTHTHTRTRTDNTGLRTGTHHAPLVTSQNSRSSKNIF